MRELLERLQTLIHRPKKAGKPKAAKKTTAKKKATHKQAAKHPSKLHHAPAPRSGTTAKPKKPASPRAATVAA